MFIHLPMFLFLLVGKFFDGNIGMNSEFDQIYDSDSDSFSPPLSPIFFTRRTFDDQEIWETISTKRRYVKTAKEAVTKIRAILTAQYHVESGLKKVLKLLKKQLKVVVSNGENMEYLRNGLFGDQVGFLNIFEGTDFFEVVDGLQNMNILILFNHLQISITHIKVHYSARNQMFVLPEFFFQELLTDLNNGFLKSSDASFLNPEALVEKVMTRQIDFLMKFMSTKTRGLDNITVNEPCSECNFVSKMLYGYKCNDNQNLCAICVFTRWKEANQEEVVER